MKEQFPRHISCRDVMCCCSLFPEGQGKQLFYSAEEQLHNLDLFKEGVVML